MRLAFLLTATLLAALGAGCIGAPGQAMTARDGLGDAMDVASRWSDGKDLHLVGAVAVEPFKHATYDSPDGKDHSEYETRLDGNPGDGRAPGWLYSFTADGRCITVVEAAGLGVLFDGYDTCDPDDHEPLPAWSVDSDAVASTLADDPAWPEPAENQTYAWALSAHDEHALWVAFVSDPSGNRTVGIVDAQNGTVLGVKNGEDADLVAAAILFDGDGGQTGAAGSDGLTKEHDEAHGTVLPEQPLRATVTLQGQGGAISFDADSQASLAVVGPVELVLTGPDGIVDSQGMPGFGGSSQVHGEYDGLAPGQYTLELHSTVGAAVAADISLDGTWS